MKRNCLDITVSDTRGLPVVSGTDLIKAVRKLGYQQVRQRGSHIKMRRELPGSARHQIIVPRHLELDRGKLNGLLTEIALANCMSKVQLTELLS